MTASFWFQGLIAVLGLAAVSGAVLFDPIARSTGGAAGTLVTTFAYPIGDFMIMGLLLTMFAVTGWRPGRATVFLGLAFAVELPADILYLFQTANGTYSTAGLLDIAWPVATMLVAHAAWQPPSRRQPHHLGRALLVLPLGFSGIAIGLLIFGNFARLSDPAAVLASLTLLAALADATIGLLQTGRLRERAVRDSLTSLMNHGEFHEAIEREIELARRDQTPVSVILLDLDGFKQVNDRHGHAEGDRVLRETAEAIRRAGRSSDVGGRLGGDEFGLLLPGADTDTALRVGARLKTAVRALGEDLSTSLGVAEWPLDGPTKEQVMFRADLALYSDKPREVERRRIEAATLATHPTGEDAADDVVERIVAVAREELQMDVAYLSQFTHGEQRYEAVAGEVESFCVKRGHGLALEQSYCQRVVDGSLPSVIPDARADERVAELAVTREADIGAYVGVPIFLSDGTVYGTLCCLSHEPNPSLTGRDAAFMRLLARLIASQLEQAGAQQQTAQLLVQASGLQALTAALEARDHYTGGHCSMVVELARGVASELRLDKQETAEIEQVALLHDIGKIGIPDHILRKNSPLDPAEWTTMRTHSILGAEIVASIESLAHLTSAIRAEHERWDGTGYPDGLARDHIPLASRVTFACDAYHAMTSDRPYRRALDPDTALRQLQVNSGTQFDPTIIAALTRALRTGHPPDPSAAPKAPLAL